MYKDKAPESAMAPSQCSQHNQHTDGQRVMCLDTDPVVTRPLSDSYPSDYRYLYSDYLRTFDKTPYPDNPNLQIDYAHMHRIAVPVLVLDALTGIIAFTVLATDVFRAQSLPVFVEIAWLAIVLALQSANMALIASNHPRLTESLSRAGFTVHTLVDQTGKLNPSDSAAIILVSYDMAAVVTAILIFFILVHLIWNLLVSFRHTQIRPEVFGEPVPDNYPWMLEAPATPTFIKPASPYHYKGTGNVFVTEETHQLA